MSELLIRAYQPGDRPALIALLKEAFPGDPPWNAPELLIDAKLAHSPQGLLVGIINDAAPDGTLVAAIIAGYDGRRGWINALSVLKSHRGQKYGEAMMDAAIAQLKAEGATKINIQIRGNNTDLQHYYENLGFAVEDVISMGLKC